MEPGLVPRLMRWSLASFPAMEPGLVPRLMRWSLGMKLGIQNSFTCAQPCFYSPQLLSLAVYEEIKKAGGGLGTRLMLESVY